MAWYEIIPDELSVNPAETWHVEVKNKKVEWVSESDKKIDHDYGSNAAAIAAYQDWLAFVNGPAGLLQEGDTVRLRSEGKNWTRENVTYTVVNVPDSQFPWWGLLGDQTGTTYFLTLSTDRVLEKVS